MAVSNENPPLKRFKKIPVYVVEEHNDALQFIYSAIGGKKLPVEGNILLHLDSHPDMLVDRNLKGVEARSGRNVLPLLQIENWILPAVAAGYLGSVVWLRPPWATQFSDGTRSIKIGDHTETGFIRLDSKEPYYLSDALYSAKLVNEKQFQLTVKETNPKDNEKDIFELFDNLNISSPYILDVDLDFFSTDNPFCSVYEKMKLYDRLESLFGFDLPSFDCTEAEFEQVLDKREKQLLELTKLFEHLEVNNGLSEYPGPQTELYHKIFELAEDIKSESLKDSSTPDWSIIFAAGCTRDQGGLPRHISSREEIEEMVTKVFRPMLDALPPPVMVTVARSTEDGYCPADQVDFIQNLVLKALHEKYETDDPYLYYLKVETC